MKMKIVKSHVEFTPESPAEVGELDSVWRIMSDCVGKEKKLVPMGVYVAEQGEAASFYIEGLTKSEEKYIEVNAPVDCDVYCKQCNKLLHIKQGEIIPICCGKMMEVMD